MYSDEEKSRYMTSICALKGRINEKLQERNGEAYESIIQLVASKEYEVAKQYDYELACFKIAASSYQVERGNESTVFDIIEYVDDYAKIYRHICELFNLIISGDTEACAACMKYVDDINISVFAVGQMITDSDISDANSVATKLALEYEKEGQIKAANYISAIVSM